MKVKAAVNNPEPAAKISFTFDDGFATNYTQVAPVLDKYGYTATSYVTTGCIGMTTVPNTCRADNDKAYMTWSQVQALQNSYKWEIGSHSVTHPYLASSDASDGQPNKLTSKQVETELSKSKSDLAARGIKAETFASPYGDYDMPVLAKVAKYYQAQRGFADTGYNNWPHSDYILRTQPVQAGVSVATVQSYIDTAIKNNQWLILTFHDVSARPSNKPDDYEYSTENLDKIARYIKTKNAEVVNVKDGIVKSDSSLFPNPSFNNGIADGWTTDSPLTIKADANSNGSFPNAAKSVKLTATTTTKHLFSPQVPVNPNSNYLLKSYLNVQKLTSGEVGFYIDEYDSNGKWISGQYMAAERTAFVEELNFTYKASSASVRYVRLQVIVAANSGITAYVDNFQMFALDNATPPQEPTNLVVNGDFNAGITAGWRTDSPATIMADAASNGSPASKVDSVKLTATATNKHLFSPDVIVDSNKTYSLSSYLDIRQRTSGEIGFYIDEYDADGNWISGQYKLGVSSLGTGARVFSYKPSSVNVKKAQLQVIVTGGSGLLAYYDDVKWTHAP